MQLDSLDLRLPSSFVKENMQVLFGRRDCPCIGHGGSDVRNAKTQSHSRFPALHGTGAEPALGTAVSLLTNGAFPLSVLGMRVRVLNSGPSLLRLLKCGEVIACCVVLGEVAIQIRDRQGK